jgi:hypothetical protein
VALRLADFPSKESYRLKIKKLKWSEAFQMPYAPSESKRNEDREVGRDIDR